MCVCADGKGLQRWHLEELIWKMTIEGPESDQLLSPQDFLCPLWFLHVIVLYLLEVLRCQGLYDLRGSTFIHRQYQSVLPSVQP